MALRRTELTQRIAAAFETEWALRKPMPPPQAGAEDRELLFAAVARGLLEYLDAKDGELFRTITLGRTGGDTTTWDIVDTEIDLGGD